MSVSIPGFNERDSQAVDGVSALVVDLLIECGERTDTAYAIGEKAATYAGQILMAILGRIVDVTDLDPFALGQAMDELREDLFPSGRPVYEQRMREDAEFLAGYADLPCDFTGDVPTVVQQGAIEADDPDGRARALSDLLDSRRTGEQ